MCFTLADKLCRLAHGDVDAVPKASNLSNNVHDGDDDISPTLCCGFGFPLVVDLLVVNMATLLVRAFPATLPLSLVACGWCQSASGSVLWLFSPATMETELAQLSINEEEEEILQIQADSRTQTDVGDYQLVGCFLTASIINFLGMKSTLANLWHPICGVQIRDLGEK
ncbi:hypothetical protein Godav_016907, partial [Gossypium davidsonii]|nr:hypothetical protein [Gossypium davidsonii]